MKSLLIALLALTSFSAVAQDAEKPTPAKPSIVDQLKQNHPNGAKCSFTITPEQLAPMQSGDLLIPKGTLFECVDADDSTRPRMIRV